MCFDCTKPLENKLELYLQNDIKLICDELCANGIVFESQFKALNSYVCKNNSLAMSHLFSKESKLDIWYEYDELSDSYVYYDIDIYSSEEAIEKSVIYQKTH